MELLLLGYILGVGVCIAHDYFVINPKLKRLIAELRSVAAELRGTTTTETPFKDGNSYD